MKAFILKIKTGIATLKANKKQLFWAWIAYQCVKGILTTSLIWIPLLVAYFS